MKAMTPIDHKETTTIEKKPAFLHFTVYGVLFIAWMGSRQLAKETGLKAPVMAALAEGRALGRAASKLAHADLLTMLPDDIETVRARLKVAKPVAYQACLKTLSALPGSEGGWQGQAKAA